jgi:hypothetical protein
MNKMKRRRLVVFALVLILLGGCAPGKYIPKPNEELYGTWINEKAVPQRVVIFAGGFKQYYQIADTVPTYSEGTLEIENKWQDAQGNIWYKSLATDLPGGEKFQTLVKISKSATVYERVYAEVFEFSPKNYPTRIDPKSGTYDIFFRSAN